MKRIYVRKPNDISGFVFKSHRSVLSDSLRMLPISYIRRGIITKEEYFESDITVAKRFGLLIIETEIDGRKKLAKSFKNFSWERVLEPSISKRIHL